MVEAIERSILATVVFLYSSSLLVHNIIPVLARYVFSLEIQLFRNQPLGSLGGGVGGHV
jgi:hypothetical protein